MEEKTPFNTDQTPDMEPVNDTEEVKKTKKPKKDKNKKDKGDKDGKSGSKVFIVLIVAIAVIALAAFGIYYMTEKKSTESANKVQTSSEDSIEIGDSKTYDSSNTDGTLSSVEIAAKVKPSVIAVEIYSSSGDLAGEGSGIVMSVDEDENRTYIVTCAHLLNESGTSIQIQTEDGTAYDATVVGYDTRTDVGVCSIKGTDLTPAEFGDSTVLQVGEPVYAIGNPGGTAFYGSVTAGIVSAIDRPISSSESGYTMECIQHDAVINPGNSGGALVNSYGQVIGINSSKIVEDSYEGMGFAVPISVAKEIVDDIMDNGYVTNRAKLGIQYLSISSNQTYSMIAQMNDLPSGSIIIAAMDDDSAFSGTDVEVGDIIIGVNGKDLDKSSTLLDLINKSSPGDELTLTIAHIDSDYKVSTFDVEITLIEDKGTSSSSSSEEEEEEDGQFVNPFQNGGSGSGSYGYGYGFGNGN